MEEKVLVIGKESISKKVVGAIFLLLFAYFGILPFIILFSSDSRSSLIRVFLFGLPLLAIAVSCLRKNNNLTVTDKRVFGEITRWFFFTRRVDLPLDSISSVGTAWPKAISVATSSGQVAFKWIRNLDEVYTTLNRLLMERQSAKPTVVMPQTRPNTAEELKQYKELLDGGVITQQEFEEKKRQLLG